jgi:hypothetical protein
MRFSKQKNLREAYENRRSKQETKYLWFPLTINGETRWLEEAMIEYDAMKYDNYYYWEPSKFINK